jgi:4-amino-4-deoxy-L-arabinose transferase-like glycosyltransferase
MENLLLRSMKSEKNTRYLLVLILFLAAILRLWKLGSIPPHLIQDEASFGYNAYSVLKTGKDIHGEIFPLIFKSFGDYRPGLYFYVLIPFIKAFGLNEFSVRLPNALAGIAAVWIIYLIVKELLTGKKLEILAPAMLAISPWHINLSRGGWEANFSLTLTLAGIYFFLKAFKNSRCLFFSSIFFALTLLTYQGSKLATLIVVLILAVLYLKDIRVRFLSQKGPFLNLLGSVFIGLIISLPIIISFFSGKVGRLGAVSVFSYQRPKDYLQAFLDQGGEEVGASTYYLFHSETLNYARGILGRWFNHFSGRFLFFEGDWQNPRHSASDHGVLLLMDLLLLPLGIFSIISKKLSKDKIFIILWLVLAPLPAVLSMDQVHAVRSLNMVIPITLVSSFGLAHILEKINNLKISKLRVMGYGLIFTFYTLSFIFFLDACFIHLPKHNAKYWHYGYKQVVEEITPIQKDYEKVVFQQSYDQPFIFFLFYQRCDPLKIQSEIRLIEDRYGDVGLVERLDNIYFSTSLSSAEKGNLIVGDDISTLGSISDDNFRLLSEIKYPNDVVAFRILEKL